MVGVVRGTLYPIFGVHTGELNTNPVRGIDMSKYPKSSENPRKSPKIPFFYPLSFWGQKTLKKGQKNPKKRGFFTPPQYYINP